LYFWRNKEKRKIKNGKDVMSLPKRKNECDRGDVK